MNIGTAAAQAGLPVKTVRYYEEIGLVRPARAENGYRLYTEQDCHKLAFVARARNHGFSVQDCRTLLALYEDKSRASADVKEVAQGHLSEIETKIAELRQMHQTLSGLVASCAGDNRPDCPILSDLAAPTKAASST